MYTTTQLLDAVGTPSWIALCPFCYTDPCRCEDQTVLVTAVDPYAVPDPPPPYRPIMLVATS